MLVPPMLEELQETADPHQLELLLVKQTLLIGLVHANH